MRSGRHLSSTVGEHPRGQCDKNKLSLFVDESNSLTPHTSYLEIGRKGSAPGGSGMIYRTTPLFRNVLIVLIKFLLAPASSKNAFRSPGFVYTLV